MDANNILVAIDDSASSERAIKQVAGAMRDPSASRITLLHVIRPVPPKILEHGGGEDPQQEQRLEAERDADQAAWRQQAEQDAQPVFANALSVLKAANVPDKAIETQIYAPVPGEDIAAAIVNVARDNACGTVVVGRSSYSWLREVIYTHVADQLMQQEPKLRLWVVEDEAAC
jgi:nucleotide-binding universal stress UspA family protein